VIRPARVTVSTGSPAGDDTDGDSEDTAEAEADAAADE